MPRPLPSRTLLSSFFVSIFTLALLLLSSSGLGLGQHPHPQIQIQVEVEAPARLEGDRIVLFYPPSLATLEAARIFLEEREAALAWVEDFFDLSYPGKLQIIIESNWFSYYSAATDSRGRRIIYVYELYPLYGLNTWGEWERTPVHELVHAVTLRGGWGRSSPFLMEGLAVAVDAIRRGQLSPHLVSKGLLLGGFLGSGLLDIRREVMSWLDYFPAGSFTLWLLDEYGLGKFRRLYELIGERFLSLWEWAGRTHPGEEELERRAAALWEEVELEARGLFGKGLDELEREWRAFLGEFAPELAERAGYALEALEGWAEVWQLRWRLGGFVEIGFLGPPPEGLKLAREGMGKALGLLLSDPSPEGAREQFERFQDQLQHYKSLLESWWAAVLAFMDAKELIYYGTASYSAILEELEEALGHYSQVGDAVMMGKVADYIEAFELLQEGERLLRELDCRAEGPLQVAAELFRTLGEERMVARVRELLERARMICELM